MLTPKFRVSYPKVFKPERNKLSNKMEYSIVALFPKGTDLTAMKKAALDACIKKWGEDKSKWPQPNPVTGQGGIRSPFRDQAEKGKKDEATGQITLPPGHEAGAIFMNFKTEDRPERKKPQIVNQRVEDIIDSTEFYAGCWAQATVNAFAYSQGGNHGISFGLGNIQKVADGDPLGGGQTRAQDDFIPIAGAADETAEAGNLFG